MPARKIRLNLAKRPARESQPAWQAARSLNVQASFHAKLFTMAISAARDLLSDSPQPKSRGSAKTNRAAISTATPLAPTNPNLTNLLIVLANSPAARLRTGI